MGADQPEWISRPFADPLSRRALARRVALAAAAIGPAPRLGRARDDGRVIAALERMGAFVERDGSLPGNPVVELRCDGRRFGDEGLRLVARVPGLKRLSLVNTGVTDAGLTHLSGLDGLEELILSVTGITDAGLAHLRGLRSLRALYAPSATTDPGLLHLAGLANLERLGLAGTGVTGTGLRHLGRLTRLSTLVLADAEGITDAGLESLPAPAGLRELHLDNTKVTGLGSSTCGGCAASRCST